MPPSRLCVCVYVYMHVCIHMCRPKYWHMPPSRLCACVYVYVCMYTHVYMRGKVFACLVYRLEYHKHMKSECIFDTVLVYTFMRMFLRITELRNTMICLWFECTRNFRQILPQQYATQVHSAFFFSDLAFLCSHDLHLFDSKSQRHLWCTQSLCPSVLVYSCRACHDAYVRYKQTAMHRVWSYTWTYTHPHSFTYMYTRIFARHRCGPCWTSMTHIHVPFYQDHVDSLAHMHVPKKHGRQH
jgi:hypothetical protein